MIREIILQPLALAALQGYTAQGRGTRPTGISQVGQSQQNSVI